MAVNFLTIVLSLLFVLPTEHPRLLVRQSDIPELRQRVDSPEGQKIIAQMKKVAVPMTSKEKSRYTWDGFRPFMQMRGVPTESTLNALNYLVDKDVACGRKAVTAMLDTLSRAEFGTKNDLSRPNGELMFIGGLVYDWCYDLLTPEEKTAYVREILRCARRMECGYPVKHTMSLCGHMSEKMILRDMLGAGIAIHDEAPELYDHVISLLEKEYIPARNYVYGGSSYHQGTSYFNARLEADLSCLWILGKAGAGQVFNDSMRDVFYDVIYRRLDDGSVMKSGDSGAFPRSYGVVMMLAGSWFKDPYLMYQYQQSPSISPNYLIFDLLFRDWTLATKAPDDLPLNRYSDEPYGSMISRTGWGKDAAVAEMRMIERFVGNHQHHDAGSFYIYYKGALALDSGFYQGKGGSYGDPHNNCYAKRTIAHNALLIYDPDEEFGKGYANDGGQRMPANGRQCRELKLLMSDDYLYGKTVSHWFDDDYSLLKCDITPAYNSSKVSDVRRSFVFANLHDSDVPAAMVVCDHVVSTNRDFKKFFLLHSVDEPAIRGNVSTVVNRGGKLECTTLIPSKPEISAVGGLGKEFMVFGKNYAMTDKHDKIPDEIGRWRLEICPSTPAEEDVFLNVLQVAGEDSRTFDVRKIDEGAVVGAAFADRLVTFSRKGALLSDDFSFTAPKGAVRKILVSDLDAGDWTVTMPGGKTQKFSVAQTENKILVSGPAGKYRFSR